MPSSVESGIAFPEYELRCNHYRLAEPGRRCGKCFACRVAALAAKVEKQARTIEFNTKANLELAADMATAVQKLTRERDAERERADEAEAKLDSAEREAKNWQLAHEKEGRAHWRLDEECNKLRAKLDAAEALLAQVVRAAEHFRYCDLAGESIEFRCERCVEADATLKAGAKAEKGEGE